MKNHGKMHASHKANSEDRFLFTGCFSQISMLVGDGTAPFLLRVSLETHATIAVLQQADK